jgi:hypothetical protein
MRITSTWQLWEQAVLVQVQKGTLGLVIETYGDGTRFQSWCDGWCSPNNSTCSVKRRHHCMCIDGFFGMCRALTMAAHVVPGCALP